MATALGEAEQQKRLGDVPGWTIDNGELVRTFTFSDFVAFPGSLLFD